MLNLIPLAKQLFEHSIESLARQSIQLMSEFIVNVRTTDNEFLIFEWRYLFEHMSTLINIVVQQLQCPTIEYICVAIFLIKIGTIAM